MYETIEGSEALFICAAGNARSDLAANPVYPACHNDLPNVISVASTKRETAMDLPSQGAEETNGEAAEHAVSWQSYLDSLSPEEKAAWDKYAAIMGGSTYCADLSHGDLDFLCEYATVQASDLAMLGFLGLTLEESLPYAQAAVMHSVSAIDLLNGYPNKEALHGFTAQMQIYLHFVNDQLYGGETDTLLRKYIVMGYSFKQVVSAYGVSRALVIDMGGLLTEKEAKNDKCLWRRRVPLNWRSRLAV